MICFSCGVCAQSVSVEFDDTGDHTFTDDERSTITAITSIVVAEVREVLPRLPPAITLTVEANSLVIPETGEMGMAPAPGRVHWTVDPSLFEGVKAIATKHLRPTLFHELHHLARGYVVQGGKPRASFMEVVISEGMANAFARDFAGVKRPWAEYPEDVSTWVDELRALPLSALRDYAKWMLKHPDGRRWIGYRAGTFIVDQAVASSGMSSAQMVQLGSQEVLELAGFD